MTRQLRTVRWHDENHRPESAGTGCYTEPPPWEPGAWEITRFEVQDGGAILHLWFTAIPARPRRAAAFE